MTNLFSHRSLEQMCILIILLHHESMYVKSCSMKQAGENAAKELGSSMRTSSWILSNSIRETSNTLSRSIDKGVDTTAATVRELAGSVKDIAKSVSVRIDRGDWSNIGATKNIRDALEELSKNWNLAVNTADLKDVGAEAARYLSEAIQNVNNKISLNIGIDDNMVVAIGYTSIAAGIAFSFCFIAVVISIKQCRSCTMALIMGCVKGCQECRNSSNNIIRPQENNEFVKENNISTTHNFNVNDENRKSKTLEDYKDLKKVQRFWEKNEPLN